MPSRRKEREAALEALYKMELSSGVNSETVGVKLNELTHDSSTGEYSLKLLEKISNNLEEVDSVITAESKNWTVGRMPVVDRNVLRIAVCELLYFADVPFKVVIDEAVEIGKRYGTKESGAFVNAILDRVASKVRPDKASAVK